MTTTVPKNKRLYYVNSRNRVTGTDSDFTYTFNIPANNRFNRVVVLQAIIPKSYYLVQTIPTGNDQFILEEDGVQTTITVPVGNYSQSSMRRVVEGLLNAASPNLWTYTITYPRTSTEAETGKYTFTVSGNGGIQPKLIFNSLFFEPLGFDAGSTNTFAADTLESADVIKLQPEDTLFIHSDMCNNGNDNILQEIFANAGNPSFSSIKFQQYTPEYYAKELAYVSDTNTYRFYLTDEDSNPIPLNGINFQMTLCFYEA